MTAEHQPICRYCGRAIWREHGSWGEWLHVSSKLALCRRSTSPWVHIFVVEATFAEPR